MRPKLPKLASLANHNLTFHVFSKVFCTHSVSLHSLRKHAYSNILKILQTIKEKLQMKILTFLYSCSKGRLWVFAQSMYFSKIRKIMYTPVNPCFTT